MYWQSFMVREPRVHTWGSLLLRLSKEEPMAMFQDAKQSLVSTAKAEREREKTAAMRDYQAEKRAHKQEWSRKAARSAAN